MRGANNCEKLTNFAISNPKTDLHDIYAHTVWWKSIDIYSIYRPEMEIGMDWHRTDTPTPNVKP